jgi:hypothetical protein
MSETDADIAYSVLSDSPLDNEDVEMGRDGTRVYHDSATGIDGQSTSSSRRTQLQTSPRILTP